MAERTTGTGITVAVGIGMAMATMAVVGAIAILANPMWGIFVLLVPALFTIAIAIARVRGHRVLWPRLGIYSP